MASSSYRKIVALGQKKPMVFSASINTGEASIRCVMYGNEVIISDEHDSDKNEKKKQQQELKSHIIFEQINGTCYTFDSADCIPIDKPDKVHGHCYNLQ